MAIVTRKMKRRFVAGARCPQCQMQDTIVLFMKNGVETIECIECDYSEQQADEKVDKQVSGDVIGIFKP